MVKIVNIIESPRKGKRLRALLSDGKYIDWWGVSLGRNFNFK